MAAKKSKSTSTDPKDTKSPVVPSASDAEPKAARSRKAKAAETPTESSAKPVKKPTARKATKTPTETKSASKPRAKSAAKSPDTPAAEVVPSEVAPASLESTPATTRRAPSRRKGEELKVVEIPLPPNYEGTPELADGVALDEFWSLVHCSCWDPHRLLGAHAAQLAGVKGLVVRAWHPDAERVELILDGTNELVPMRRLEVPGVFGVWLPGRDFPLRYKFRFIFRQKLEWVTADPYAFLPSLGELDIHLHGEGNHLHAYRKFGAQVREINGTWGVSFCVWAPSARRVSVIGEFNNWDGRLNPMRSMGSSGVWELFVPAVRPGMGYKFEILTQDQNLRYKADPYAFGFDLRPSTHSKVVDHGTYRWHDHKYMQRLEDRRYLEEPMAVYEVHLGSWMRVPEEGNRWLTYRELAERLVPHCKRYAFTHVELLPVAEHPFDGSWGYQVTGYYAPTSRFGTPDDFKFFVDYLHQHDIGVIVDWVPAHFPRDDFALRWFDGSPLYEHADPRRGEHKDWGTLIFDYGRPEVKNFLLSNALFWLDLYHVDGLRVDAVASMLYLDYSRQPGEWVPNQYGGRENLEAVAFLRQLNEVVHGQYPGRFTVAEESTAFPGVSRPTYMGGLGFTFKWNMGWMNDTLRYFSKDPVFRKYHQNDLTFALVYQYTENFVLPFSHDEVVHGKGSILGKMPGDQWQKFANVRLLYSYLYAHPGKKLLFMGAEFAQSSEWHYDRSLDWHEAGAPLNKGVERALASLGWIYLENREFWLFDNDPIGFRWIDFNDHESSVLAFVRQGPEGHTVCIFNFTPIPRYGYRLGMPAGGKYREIYNSDAHEYGGGGVGNYGQVWTQEAPVHGCRFSAQVNIPPLGAVFLKHDG